MSETNIGWHVDDAHLVAYVQRCERSFATASTEAHLLECQQCRSSLASLRGTSLVSASAQSDTWAGITMRIDRPSIRPAACSRGTPATPAPRSTGFAEVGRCAW